MKSLFGKGIERVSKAKIIYILVCCIIALLLLNGHSANISTFALLALLISFVWDINFPIAVYICFSIMKVDMGTLGNAIAMTLITITALQELLNNKKRKTVFRVFLLIGCVFVPFVLLSHLCGINSSWTTTIVMLFRWVCVYYIANRVFSNNEVYLLYALLFSGLTVLVYHTINPISVFDEEALYNTKDVATVLAVPVYILLWVVINNRLRLLYKIVFLLVAITCIVAIVFTYSRGVLIALFISLLYVLFTGVKNKRSLTLIVSALVFVAFLSTSDIVVDYERLTSNLEGANGRNLIWNNYFAILSQSVIRFLFGCGPNGLSELSQSGAYAHSAILDYFFSYGLFGLVFILVILVTLLKYLIKSKNRFYIGLYVLNILMFVTHGNYMELLFLSLIGLCMGGACTNNHYSIPIDNR